MHYEKLGDGPATFTVVVQHYSHRIGWSLLHIVVPFRPGTFVENPFVLDETSDLSAKKRNRSVILKLGNLTEDQSKEQNFSALKLLKLFNIRITIDQKLSSMIFA